MLVGAGIGVTPFASILRSFVARQKLPGNIMPKVYFYWLCRSPQEFASFKNLMQDTISSDIKLKKYFEFNLYMSGETNVNSNDFQKTLGEFKDWCKLYTGRPNWKRIFQEKKQNHPDTTIGVFLCGPPQIGAQLEANSRKFSDNPNVPNGKRNDKTFLSWCLYILLIFLKKSPSSFLFLCSFASVKVLNLYPTKKTFKEDRFSMLLPGNRENYDKPFMNNINKYIYIFIYLYIECNHFAI